jgi:hypothetical protein
MKSANCQKCYQGVKGFNKLVVVICLSFSAEIGYCSNQSFKLYPLFPAEVAANQFGLSLKKWEGIKESTFPPLEARPNEMQCINFPFPHLKIRPEISPSRLNPLLGFTPSGQSVGPDGDRNSPCGGHKSTAQGWGYFFKELIQWLALTAFALAGMSMAFLLAVPIERWVTFVIDFPGRFLTRFRLRHQTDSPRSQQANNSPTVQT